MNYWTNISIEFANQRNYLDELYRVYPICSNLRRELPDSLVNAVTDSFNRRDNVRLVKELLKSNLFPIKDSYIPYLRKDKNAIERNPNTINRIAGNLYAMGLDNIIDKCSEPKESNRQMGPLFKNWLMSGVLGCSIYESEQKFIDAQENCILVGSDAKLKNFAIENLGYKRYDKGVDLIGKFNNKYVIGEAKFITDFGGHQNDQFVDAIATITSDFDDVGKIVVPIAILDGVLYIRGNHKLYNHLVDHEEQNILSALVLREFLYSL